MPLTTLPPARSSGGLVRMNRIVTVATAAQPNRMRGCQANAGRTRRGTTASAIGSAPHTARISPSRTDEPNAVALGLASPASVNTPATPPVGSPFVNQARNSEQMRTKPLAADSHDPTEVSASASTSGLAALPPRTFDTVDSTVTEPVDADEPTTGADRSEPAGAFFTRDI
ncbi:MAG: hypothetical protein ACLP8S_19865 [Solirubrobacteraceae bacterium]